MAEQFPKALIDFFPPFFVCNNGVNVPLYCKGVHSPVVTIKITVDWKNKQILFSTRHPFFTDFTSLKYIFNCLVYEEFQKHNISVTLCKWIIIGNKKKQQMFFLPLTAYLDMKLYICHVLSPSLCWLLPMHGSFAVMSSNFNCWNSWPGYILLLQQWVCCWYFEKMSYREHYFFFLWRLFWHSHRPHLDLTDECRGILLSFISRSSSSWLEQHLLLTKELLFSTMHSILNVVLPWSGKYLTFCLAQRLFMPIPWALLHVISYVKP